MPEPPPNEPFAELISISGWTVDVSTHRISKAGDTVRLEPRTMAVFAYLARRPGQAVSREELEREVWRGLVVGYDALSNAVAKLRKAFGDDPRNPHIIETIPKVGYRLIPPVEQLVPAPALLTLDRSLERKLTAILYADVAGYSRLTGQDEDGTHRALRSRLDHITSSVQAYNGRVVHFAGDAMLADFRTVSDAVTCAVAVQQAFASQDAEVASERQVRFRIGVNLGEVIVDRDDIYGDGVNIASRLEALAEPGGVCVSGTVFDAVGHNLPLDFEFLGEQSVKNIAKPVRAYSALLRAGGELPGPTAGTTDRVTSSRRVAPFAYGAAAIVALALVVIVLLRPDVEPEAPPVPSPRQHASVDATPTVAVLPFDNLSGDAEQDFFADGMTDNLITDLSKVSGLIVIAHHSVRLYRGTPRSPAEVARELGARYVVQGSVQRAGGQMRISTGLVDGSSGAQLWGERYDRPEMDVFALQDEVTAAVVSALSVRLTDAEQSRLSRRGTDNLEAYDLYLRANHMLYYTPPLPGGGYDKPNDPIPLYREAIALDPQFTDAYAGIAQTAVTVWQWDQTDVMPPAAARRLAYEAASKLLGLDEDDPRAYGVLAMLQALDGEHEQAIRSARRSLVLAPNDADAHVVLAHVLVFAGQHSEARTTLSRAFQLNPRPPPQYFSALGMVLFFQRDYEGALAALRKATHDVTSVARLRAMTYAELGRLDESKSDLERLYRGIPFANLAYFRTTLAHFRRKEDLEHYLSALAKLGVPAWPFGYEPDSKDQIDSPQLAGIAVGHSWSGRDASGAPFVAQFTDDGRVAFRSRTTLRTGTMRIHQGMLCVNFPGALLGREDCGYVYRNPSGSHEAENEYVRVALGQVYYFTVAR